MQEKRQDCPDLSTTGTDVSLRNNSRVIPMKVLSLGMPRTGTASMQLALKILGYECYYGVSLVANLRDTEMWSEALDAKFFGKGPLFTREKWDQLLGRYSAVSDLPAVAFAEDLVQCYPDAKVVLVEQDIEEWYHSFNNEETLNVWNPTIRLIARLDTKFVGKLGNVSGRWTEGWMKARSRTEMQENARLKYREHYALVERTTPPERLLKYRLDQGWKPLCAFLDRPLPDVDFPRLNESAALREEIGLIVWRGCKNAAMSSLKVLMPIAVLALAWLVIRSSQVWS